MGGMTIMCLAAARPELFGDRVRGVGLVSTSAGDLAPSGRRSPSGSQLKLAPGMLTVALAGARALERLRRLLPPTHPRHQKIVRDLLYGADATDEMVLAGAEIMHASTVRAFTAFLPALGEHDKRAELTALTLVPVEILVGDSDKLTPKRHARQLADVLPDADLHVVDRTGHMLPQERPQLVTDAIERLLAAAIADRVVRMMTGDRLPPRAARLRRSAGDRRAQLVQIGLELLPTTPVQELTFDEVARRAGISRSLLFHYFATKRDYYTAVTRAAADLLWETCSHARAPRRRRRSPACSTATSAGLRPSARPTWPSSAAPQAATRGCRRSTRTPGPGWSTSRWRRWASRTTPGAGSWCWPGSPSPRTWSASGPASPRCPGPNC